MLGNSLGRYNSLSYLEEFNSIVGNMLFRKRGIIRFLGMPPKAQLYFILSKLYELNEIKDPELRALKYFCFITKTHLFLDGNKRVAQLMANKILIENDIGIFQINIEDLEDFKSFLVQFYRNGNDTKIIEFMKKKCVKHVAEEYANLK